jgi:hypothetical protein
MVQRSSKKKRASSSDDSEYSFHLVGKKMPVDASTSVVGTIVSGPASILLSGVLGTPATQVKGSGKSTGKKKSSAKAVANPPKAKAKPGRKRARGRRNAKQ